MVSDQVQKAVDSTFYALADKVAPHTLALPSQEAPYIGPHDDFFAPQVELLRRTSHIDVPGSIAGSPLHGYRRAESTSEPADLSEVTYDGEQNRIIIHSEPPNLAKLTRAVILSVRHQATGSFPEHSDEGGLVDQLLEEVYAAASLGKLPGASARMHDGYSIKQLRKIHEEIPDDLEGYFKDFVQLYHDALEAANGLYDDSEAAYAAEELIHTFYGQAETLLSAGIYLNVVRNIEIPWVDKLQENVRGMIADVELAEDCEAGEPRPSYDFMNALSHADTYEMFTSPHMGKLAFAESDLAEKWAPALAMSRQELFNRYVEEVRIQVFRLKNARYEPQTFIERTLHWIDNLVGRFDNWCADNIPSYFKVGS